MSDQQPEATVQIGLRRVRAALPVADGATLSLPGPLAERLGVPPGVRLQAQVEPRRVTLGPYVAILAARTPHELTPTRLTAMENHLLSRRHRGGLFVVIDRSALSAAGDTVEGYRFSNGGWEKGSFPMPAVILRRYGVSLEGLLPPLLERGVQVVNERIFHKGEAGRWLAAESRLAAYVPETVELVGPATVAELLTRHRSVFIKPAWGSLAAGIVRVQRQGEGYRVEPSGGAPIDCAGTEALREALAGRLPGAGIVQQGLELAAIGGRMIDFRVVVQKDGAGDWAVPGIVARCGEDQLFVSNMATGGFPLPVEDGLRLLFGPSPSEIFRRKEEMAALGLAAAQALERGGLLIGDLGLDIAYDRGGRPWLIEANNRDPDHNIGWEAGSWPLFYEFRRLPLDHACHLAGFGRES